MNNLFELIISFAKRLELDYAFIKKSDDEITSYIIVFKSNIDESDLSLDEDSMQIQLDIENGVAKEPYLHLDTDIALTLTFESLNQLNQMLTELKRFAIE